jgi:hypothetical protein
VMRPIDVSMTTVGPLGWMVAATVAWGASGKSAAGAGDEGVAAGGVDCAIASAPAVAPRARS